MDIPTIQLKKRGSGKLRLIGLILTPKILSIILQRLVEHTKWLGGRKQLTPGYVVLKE